jgi:hypothetical protein
MFANVSASSMISVGCHASIERKSAAGVMFERQRPAAQSAHDRCGGGLAAPLRRGVELE